MHPTIDRNKELVDRLRLDSASPDDVANLLDYFRSGQDLKQLRELLISPNAETAEKAAWILSELGQIGRPLLAECQSLLAHQRKLVRFYALDSILANAPVAAGDTVAKAILLLKDPERAVQWKCLNLLRRIDAESLVTARSHTEARWVQDHLEWLLNQLESPSLQEISSQVHSPSFEARAFAAVAAARGGRLFAPALAALLVDRRDSIADFAKHELEDLALQGPGKSAN